MTKPTIKQIASLIGNKSAYAQQTPDGEGYVAVRNVTAEMWHEAVSAHLNGHKTIGTYSIHNGNQARTLVFDVDEAGDLDLAKKHATAIGKALLRLRVPRESIGVEFSGHKGFHVWVVLDSYVEARQLRRVGRAVLALTGIDCEVFPKQDNTDDLGSQVKLPGGKHRKTGKENNFLTPFPKLLDGAMWKTVIENPELPEDKRASFSVAPEVFPCMTAIQDGVSEGAPGRNKALYHFCVMARRGGLNDELVQLAAETVNSRFDPPLKDEEFVRTVNSSKNGGPLCNDLADTDIGCGDACICRPGMKLRTGQLRYAGPGETVVVQLKGRNGTILELDHPDLIQAKGRVEEKK